MERRAFGVQSIICIYCKKKNNSAFKCHLVSRVIRRVPSLAGRLREAEYESLGMLSATLTLGLFQVCPSLGNYPSGQRNGRLRTMDSVDAGGASQGCVL